MGGKQGGAENAISALGWNPNGSHQLLAAAVGSNVVLIVTGTGDSDASEVTETLLSEAEEQALTKGAQDKEDDEDEEEVEEEEAEEEDEEDNKKARKKIISTWHLHPSRNTSTSTGKGKKRTPAEDSNPLGRVGRHGELVGPRLTLRLLSKSASGKGVAPLTKLVWHHKGDHTHSQYIISTHSILIKHSIINQTLLYHYPYH